MSEGPRPGSSRSGSSQFVRKLARLLSRVVYRSVEVVNPYPGWMDRPALIVANHFAGFADPALMIGLLSRRPRFLAKATLWKIPLLGWLLNYGGAVPVYRAQDGATTSNVDTFAACTEALRTGQTIAIFPEGTTHDDPAIRHVKTGAARIALGARASGVRGVQIVPIGLHFEDKAAIRSRVFVRVGRPLDLDTELVRIVGPDRGETPDDHTTVTALTAEIERMLRAAAPNFADLHEARALSLAAEAALRSTASHPDVAVPLAARSMLADGMATLNDAPRSDIVAASDAYRRGLDALGVTDRQLSVTSGTAALSFRLLGTLALATLLLPFALAGLAMNVAPYLAVRLVGRIRTAPVTMATIKVLAALVAFGAMWGFWAYLAIRAYSWQAGVIAFVAAPVYGAVTVWVSEHLMSIWAAWRGGRRARRSGPMTSSVLLDRRVVVGSVVDGLLPSTSGSVER